MGATIAEKVMSRVAGSAAVAGDTVMARPDLVMVNDAAAPLVFKQVRDHGRTLRFPDRVVLVADHFVPASDPRSASFLKIFREAAAEHGVRVFDQGRGGIAHALLPEQGLVTPGTFVIGTDSHTTTYGAYSAFGVGYGSTDVAVALAEGHLWVRVPQSIRVRLSGTMPPDVHGKDVALALLGLIGQDGASYRALEFSSEDADALSLADRAAISNMAAEAGAKAAVFESDATLHAWARSHSLEVDWELTRPDADAGYERTIDLRLDELTPLVARPGSPSDVVTVKEVGRQPIQQAYLGNCANGTLEDLEQAAAVLRDRKLAPTVRMIVVPATQQVYAEALRTGLLQVFIDSGALVSMPTCGACFGGHNGVLDAGEGCIANINRNYPGRMGDVAAQVWLANSAVVAASAVAGRICEPEEL